ncbi:MAG: hypothetical protein IPP44_25205 [Ideonella sp.]|jgi:hypothetical protein|nr:hypothetical protein [Ideonella sp.]
MGLRLHAVPANRGAWWIRAALALWWKRPMAFVGLFMFFLFGVLMLMMLPLVGPLLGLGLVPMLTLGFMIASQSALQGGPVHALQMFEGLRVPDKPRRNAQLMLCAIYALASIGVIELAAWVDEGLFEQLQIAMATPATTSKAVQALLNDPRLANGMVVRLVAATLLSIPFWHAPALVHWGHQGAGQALFSSTMALWRAKGAFALYAFGWAMLSLGMGLLATAAVLLLGSGQWISVLIMPAGLTLSTVFYVSLWFGFADSFGEEVVTPPAQP